MDTIRIHNMSFYGYHGVDASERDLGGKFHVDVELNLDLRAAGESDQIADTVDYKAVYELVAQIQGGHSFRLLEALAHAVAEGILQHFDVSQVTVRIRKAAVPLGGLIDYAEVEVTRPVV
ncbi:MAG: dihydroneopterin aldolase [candidate division WS1 bacterium]|jgi:dihydroneopterin aldolase|nr:dihydroneopterin aldolase [candidate division WS1 bacterium]